MHIIPIESQKHLQLFFFSASAPHSLVRTRGGRQSNCILFNERCQQLLCMLLLRDFHITFPEPLKKGTQISSAPSSLWLKMLMWENLKFEKCSLLVLQYSCLLFFFCFIKETTYSFLLFFGGGGNTDCLDGMINTADIFFVLHQWQEARAHSVFFDKLQSSLSLHGSFPGIPRSDSAPPAERCGLLK